MKWLIRTVCLVDSHNQMVSVGIAIRHQTPLTENHFTWLNQRKAIVDSAKCANRNKRRLFAECMVLALLGVAYFKDQYHPDTEVRFTMLKGYALKKNHMIYKGHLFATHLAAARAVGARQHLVLREMHVHGWREV